MKKLFCAFYMLFVFAVACKPVDEKRKILKAEIGAFEKDWAATTDIVNNWGLALKEKMAQDSLVKQNCSNLLNNYNDALKVWEKTTKEFAAWKVNFDNNKEKTEDALKKLRSFKEVLEKYNSQTTVWEEDLKNCSTTTQQP